MAKDFSKNYLDGSNFLKHIICFQKNRSNISVESMNYVFEKMLKKIIAVSVLLALVACSKLEAGESAIETSVSSDGQWIAVLSKKETKESKVRIMNINVKKWIDINAPALTSSIHFGRNGSDLLLTNFKSDETSEAELVLINVTDNDYKRITIYKGLGLAFPLEVEDGQYLIRACNPASGLNCHRAVGVHWLLIKNNVVQAQFVSKSALNYSQPNYIHGIGFYWNVYKTDPSHSPESIGFKLNGSEIKDDILPLVETTEGAPKCDYQNYRCIKTFFKYKNERKVIFDYGISGHLNGEICQFHGVYGYLDGISITPDGNYGVASLAKDIDSPRHVVYITFDSQKCRPKNIEHLKIN